VTLGDVVRMSSAFKLGGLLADTGVMKSLRSYFRPCADLVELIAELDEAIRILQVEDLIGEHRCEWDAERVSAVDPDVRI